MILASDWIAFHANRTPDKIAMIDQGTGRQVTYAEFNDRSARLAGYLHDIWGVEPGDRVAILAKNSTDYFEAEFACIKLGALMLPLNWRLAEPELLFGFTGVISFGHALFFGMGGYSLGLALEHTSLDTGLALVVGIIAGLVVSSAISLLIGVVSLRLRGVYFAIFTLAIAEMFFIFFSRLPLTRAEDGFAITELPQWLDPSQSRLTFYYVVLGLFALTFLFIQRVTNSPTGAVFQSIRENEDRAQAIGYNTLNYKLLSITLAGIIAAAAGMLQVLLNKKVGPEILGVNYTVDPLLMTIIGGIGTLTGPVIGASGLTLLDTLFRDSSVTLGEITIHIADIWSLLLGCIFIAVVIVFPQGVVGTLGQWVKRLRR